jgi:hypothetical protein
VDIFVIRRNTKIVSALFLSVGSKIAIDSPQGCEDISLGFLVSIVNPHRVVEALYSLSQGNRCQSSFLQIYGLKRDFYIIFLRIDNLWPNKNSIPTSSPS